MFVSTSVLDYVDPDGCPSCEGDDTVVAEVLEGVLVHVAGDHQVGALLEVVPGLQVVQRLHLALLLDQRLQALLHHLPSFARALTLKISL